MILRSILPAGIAVLLTGCGGATAPARHTLSVTPAQAEVVSGMSQQFQAVVGPEGSDQTINWSVGGPGAVSASGLYQAPPFSGNVSVDLTANLIATSRTHGVSSNAKVTIPSAATLMSRGWTSYLSGDFEEANGFFSSALSTVVDYPPARAGNAWIDFREDRADDALAVWLEAAQVDDPDALAGLVLLYASRDSSSAVVLQGKELIRVDSGYIFAGDPEYSISDVRWLLARAALDTGQYQETGIQLDALVPGNGLDPFAASFPEDALALLVSIQGTV